MNELQRISDKLEGKSFSYGYDERLTFTACKKVNLFFMVKCLEKTLQVDVSNVDDFLDDIIIIETKPTVQKAMIPGNMVFALPETHSFYSKLFTSMEAILDEVNTADVTKMEVLAKKAKVITELGVTAVAMENSRTNLLQTLKK
jgi:hypothetical protein